MFFGDLIKDLGDLFEEKSLAPVYFNIVTLIPVKGIGIKLTSIGCNKA